MCLAELSDWIFSGSSIGCGMGDSSACFDLECFI